MMPEKRADLGLKFPVAAALDAEKGINLRCVERLRRSKQVLDAAPALRGHRSEPVREAESACGFICRNNQARARLQSRMMVLGETLRTAAVSSTLIPPKNRSSITWALRGSSWANSSSESLSNTNWSGLSMVHGSSSSRVTDRAAPSRLSACAGGHGPPGYFA